MVEPMIDDDDDDGYLSSPSSPAAALSTPPIEVVVVTDSARILGLGDCGAGGMGISEGKILLYTAVGGVSPEKCLPVCLDVGTNNQKLLSDPLYRGIKKPRETGEVLDALVSELVGALKELLRREKKTGGGPSRQQTRTTLLQFEDFASSSAFRLLEKFAPCGLPCFNDDVQGTASVGLAALLAALRLGDSSSSSLTSAGSSSSGGGGEEEEEASSSPPLLLLIPLRGLSLPPSPTTSCSSTARARPASASASWWRRRSRRGRAAAI